MAGIKGDGLGHRRAEKWSPTTDLTATLDTNDAWIVERTGIRERRVGGDDLGTGHRGRPEALDKAGLTPATSTWWSRHHDARRHGAGTATTVQNALGINGGAFDVKRRLFGFVYGLVTPPASPPWAPGASC